MRYHFVFDHDAILRLTPTSDVENARTPLPNHPLASPIAHCEATPTVPSIYGPGPAASPSQLVPSPTRLTPSTVQAAGADPAPCFPSVALGSPVHSSQSNSFPAHLPESPSVNPPAQLRTVQPHCLSPSWVYLSL